MNPHDVPSAGELVEGGSRMAAERRAGSDRRHGCNTTHVSRSTSCRSSNASWRWGRHTQPPIAIACSTLGVADDAALAAAIRSGALDDRMDEVRALVWQSVRDKLAVANPKYLTSP